MIRIIGSLLVVGASTMIGMVLASRYSQRPRQIRQWRSALQAIEAEIVYGRVPIEELSADLASQLPQPVAHFFEYLRAALVEKFQPLKEAWKEAVIRYWPETSLKNAEREVILQFGTTLGTEDAENQKKHIQLALSHLEREEIEARAAQDSHEKMMRSLGFLAGILVALLLI
ncbi:MAG: stage III sporulation protein SpoIIIAB [Sporolactobacillus sp.]